MSAYERTKPVEQMIVKVMRKKDVSEKDAINYMLGVATGRLAALWRYDESLPEGKDSKGVLMRGRKKAAEKTKMISTRVVADDKPAKPKATKPKATKPKADKPKAAKRKPSKRKPKPEPPTAQLEIAAAE